MFLTYIMRKIWVLVNENKIYNYDVNVCLFERKRLLLLFQAVEVNEEVIIVVNNIYGVYLVCYGHI